MSFVQDFVGAGAMVALVGMGACTVNAPSAGDFRGRGLEVVDGGIAVDARVVPVVEQCATGQFIRFDGVERWSCVEPPADGKTYTFGNGLSENTNTNAVSVIFGTAANEVAEGDALASTQAELARLTGVITVDENDGDATITGTLTAGNITTSGTLTATGTLTAGSMTTSGTLTAADATIGTIEADSIKFKGQKVCMYPNGAIVVGSDWTMKTCRDFVVDLGHNRNQARFACLQVNDYDIGDGIYDGGIAGPSDDDDCGWCAPDACPD